MQENDIRLTEAEGYFRVAEVLADMNQFEEAVEQYRASLALYDGDAIIHHQLGLALLHTDDPTSAAEPLQRAVELNPSEPRFWVNRGYCAYLMKNETLAASCYDRALALDGTLADAWFNRAHLLLMQRRPAEAIEGFQRTVALKPDDPDAWYNLGIALHDVERYEESVTAYRAALELVPDESSILHNMGVSLLRLGRLDEAREQLEHAAALGLPEAWHTLAIVMETLGLFEEAEVCREKANPE